MKHRQPILQAWRRVMAPIVGWCLLLWGQAALAQICTTTGVAPVFVGYQASGPGAESAGSVSVTCVVLGILGQSVSYTVNLGPGGQAQGMQRRMGSGAAFLRYNFYCDSGRSQVWADGSGGTCRAAGGQAGLLGTLLTVYPVYASIPGQQYVTPGAYSDLVSIEVLY